MARAPEPRGAPVPAGAIRALTRAAGLRGGGMRVLHVSEDHGRYAAAVVRAALPTPRAGETLVRVAASGLNRADLAQIAGRYPAPAGEPETLGLEISGTIVDSGEQICALLAGGGHAEYAVCPVGQVMPLPRAVDLISAAAIPEAYLTAFVNLVIEAGVRRGETVLVHAGASGVGLAAIQLAKYLGARVAATTRTAEKLPALAAAGADLGIDASRESPAATIEQRWGPDAVDVVLDPVGAATLAGNLHALRTGGRVIHLATMSGSKTELDIALLMRKRARLIGSTLRARSREEKATIVARFREQVLPAFDGGQLRVTIDSVFSPEQAAQAFQRMRDNRNTGKILIDWSGRSAEPAPAGAPAHFVRR
jgi:putative PIG3 family NAD(P)H quinone oxidoreductase